MGNTSSCQVCCRSGATVVPVGSHNKVFLGHGAGGVCRADDPCARGPGPLVPNEFSPAAVGRALASEETEERRRQDALLSAARAGDFKKTAAAMASGCDLHSRTLRGQTSLMLAAAARTQGSQKCVKFLLEFKAELEAVDDEGWTALHHACRNQRESQVELLLEQGASISASTGDGKSVVMLATSDHADDLVLKLLDKRASLEKRDFLGWSVLLYACKEGRHQLAHKLLDRNGSALDKAKDGMTALMCAAEGGNLRLGQELVRKNADVNSRNGDGVTPLMLALQSCSVPLAEWLLEEKADILAENNAGLDVCDVADASGIDISFREILRMRAGMVRKERDGTGQRRDLGPAVETPAVQRRGRAPRATLAARPIASDAASLAMGLPQAVPFPV